MSVKTELWKISDAERDNIAAELTYYAKQIERNRDHPGEMRQCARAIGALADRVANIESEFVEEPPKGKKKKAKAKAAQPFYDESAHLYRDRVYEYMLNRGREVRVVEQDIEPYGSIRNGGEWSMTWGGVGGVHIFNAEDSFGVVPGFAADDGEPDADPGEE